MNLARGLLFGLLIALGLARLLAYLAYAVACLPMPLETFFLEAKMVLLAYRVVLGETLYPAWRDYPHVSNFFGPVYFGLVGLLGSAFKVDIPGLFLIGRAVSFASGLLTTLVVGIVAGRRYGRFAGAAGSVLSLGSATMIGFSVMVRPDMMAELLGVCGFFLGGHRTAMGRLAGGGLLVLAILTKQTTAIFLLAASLAWVLEGDWRRGLKLLLGCLGATAVVIGAVTLLVEPNFARSLFGESKSPWEVSSFVSNLTRACWLSPDILFFPTLGLVLWLSGATGRREIRPAVLTAVVLAASIGLATKRGGDLNYYLSLRVCEGLAVGALWRAWSLSCRARAWVRSTTLATSTLLGCMAMWPGILFATLQAESQRKNAAFVEGPYGADFLGFHRDICGLARNPRFRLLTDSGLFELYQGKRAAFGDPWLFRMMSETGQVDLTVMQDRVDSRYYDLIVTTGDLELPSYYDNTFGLPRPLFERARVRYVQVGTRAGLFLYKPRQDPGLPPRPDPSPD